MKKNAIRAKNGKRPPAPEFVARAERALHRVARNVRAEKRRLGLPLIVWEHGKVREARA
ncbi:MAG: hypothetical protein WC740_21210 [Verrucomicrobiia bacterium]